MYSRIVREGCREAELHCGCGILAVEAIEAASSLWSLLSSPRSLPTPLHSA